MNDRNLINLAGAIIGMSLVGLLGFAMWALIYHAIPKENLTAFNLLIGILSANVGMVIGFYYGSSSANKTKDATIAKLADTAQTAGNVIAAAAPTQDTMTMKPGTTATATTTTAGTVIHKEDTP